MKKLLLVLCFVGCNTQAAITCADEIDEKFIQVKARAEFFLHISLPTKWIFLKQLETTNIIAAVRLDSIEYVYINELNMCSRQNYEIEAIIAHEFGHIISRTLASEYMLTDTGKEDKANYYGAKMTLNSINYLKLVDARCMNGSEYECRTAVSWRNGLAD